MPVFYLAKRVGIFFLIVWLAATLNFFLPRIGGREPCRPEGDAAWPRSAAICTPACRTWSRSTRRSSASIKPLWQQYLTYLVDMTRFDFGYSIANYPRRVSDMILEGLPWTICSDHGDDDHFLRHRQRSRRVPGVAARAALADRCSCRRCLR